jgi:sporulation protein YlmC with PRC-barrel domain
MIRSSDMQGKRVRTLRGEQFGYVFEIQIKRGRVEALMCGRRGLWQRLTYAHTGHRIPWTRVLKITEEIVLAD